MNRPAQLASDRSDDVRSTAAQIRIEPVDGRRKLEAFIRLPNRLHRDYPNYVAPLLIERRDILRFDKNAYFQHAEGQYWLAWRDDRPVGRISAQIDRLYLEKYQNATGHFGMLDAEDDPAVFRALLETAEGWLRARGMERVLGPFNLSINEECGLLIDGFDAPPMLMMGFAPPYAARRVEELGYRKAKDLMAYDYDVTSTPPIRGEAMLERTSEAHRVRVRPVDMSRYDAELAVIMDIFNDAWSENWGSVPFTEAEITHVANGMRPADPAGVGLDRRGRRRAGLHDRLPAQSVRGDRRPQWQAPAVRLGQAAVAAQDAAAAHRPRAADGHPHRLSPHPAGLRPDPHGAGIAAPGLTKEGLERIELSWMLEDNLPMRRVIESIGGRIYKTYRIYEKPVV